MSALLVIWGWLIVGAIIGRAVFVRILGDQSRRGTVQRRGEYGHRYTKENGWTGAFTRALWAALACLVAWPVALPVTLMLAHTGTEKLRAERQRLEAEIADLQRDAAAAGGVR
jgi:hypothetical protein